jgi:hypothetical protein
MLVYHGTTSRHLDAILREGLCPRSDGGPGNWEDYPSRPDMVYLTQTYAPYFALAAIEEGEQPVILEIDLASLDESALYPDEDFVVQALCRQLDESIEELHDGVRECLEDYQHHAMDSLQGLGNICHMGPIPASAITRYCRVDLSLQPDFFAVAGDPCISLLNFKFMAEKYRSVTAWLFGDRPDYLIGIGPNEMQFAIFESQLPGYRQRCEEAFGTREGITVCSGFGK